VSAGQRISEVETKAGRCTEESVRVPRARMVGAVGVEDRSGGAARPVRVQIITEAGARGGGTANGISLVAGPVDVEGVAGLAAVAAADVVGDLTAVMSS